MLTEKKKVQITIRDLKKEENNCKKNELNVGKNHQ